MLKWLAGKNCCSSGNKSTQCQRTGDRVKLCLLRNTKLTGNQIIYYEFMYSRSFSKVGQEDNTFLRSSNYNIIIIMSRLVHEPDINSFKHYYYNTYVIHSRFTKYNGVFIK